MFLSIYFIFYRFSIHFIFSFFTYFSLSFFLAFLYDIILSVLFLQLPFFSLYDLLLSCFFLLKLYYIFLLKLYYIFQHLQVSFSFPTLTSFFIVFQLIFLLSHYSYFFFLPFFLFTTFSVFSLNFLSFFLFYLLLSFFSTFLFSFQIFVFLFFLFCFTCFFLIHCNLLTLFYVCYFRHILIISTCHRFSFFLSRLLFFLFGSEFLLFSFLFFFVYLFLILFPSFFSYLLLQEKSWWDYFQSVLFFLAWADVLCQINVTENETDFRGKSKRNSILKAISGQYPMSKDTGENAIEA